MDGFILSELNIKLLPWQQEVWKDKARFKVVAAGRRTGKSRLAASMLIVKGLEAKSGSIFYVAPTQQMARELMWDTVMELGEGVIRSSHKNDMTFTLINGTTIYLKSGEKESTLRGAKLYFVVLDEFSDMKASIWDTILRPALVDLAPESSALFIGTPTGRNHFYDLFCEAESGNDPNLKAWHFTSFDNTLIDHQEIEMARKSMSTFAFNQEFMASFAAQASLMFKSEWIKYGESPEEGSYFIAIDLAGFSEVGTKQSKNLDDTAISVVKVNKDGWFVEDIIYGRWDLSETAEIIFEKVKEFAPLAVGIERGIARQAVMAPLSEMMRRSQTYFHVEMLTHGNKSKTDRIMWALQGRFENGQITLKQGDWNAKFEDQMMQFPDKRTHDDLIDSLSYVSELVKNYTFDFVGLETTEHEYTDSIAGY